MLALEFARTGYRIRGNAIHPGIIDTEMGDQTIAAARAQAGAAHPIGRLGTVADIANGIVFLASDDDGFMTGAGLVVDSGWTAQ